MKDDRPTVPCKVCGLLTPMTGTELCDRCWELDRAINGNPDIAKKILAKLTTLKEAQDE